MKCSRRRAACCRRPLPDPAEDGAPHLERPRRGLPLSVATRGRCLRLQQGPGGTMPSAGIVDDANVGRIERNVEADIMALLIHAFLRVTFDTAELTGCAWSAADALLAQVLSS